jgi:hypothetical protein
VVVVMELARLVPLVMADSVAVAAVVATHLALVEPREMAATEVTG